MSDNKFANKAPTATQNNSYVDSYTPPAPPMSGTMGNQPAPFQTPIQEPTIQTPPPDLNSPAFLKPTPVAPKPKPAVFKPAPDMPANAPTNVSEELEDQNIFDLLGVTDGTDPEKEQFLDELQQVIWEDFLESDLELLVTEDELKEVKDILAKTDKKEMEKQEAVIVYLEQLIPDLEEIMMEKALELKEEMVKERILSLKEFYQGQTDKIDTIAKAEDLFNQDKWLSGSKLINSLQ
jgi:hypothetical protein